MSLSCFFRLPGKAAEITSIDLPDIETSFYVEESKSEKTTSAKEDPTLLPARTYEEIVPERMLRSLQELHESVLRNLKAGEEVSEGNKFDAKSYKK